MAKRQKLKKEDVQNVLTRENLKGKDEENDSWTLTWNESTKRFDLKHEGSLLVSSVNYHSCTSKAACNFVSWE